MSKAILGREEVLQIRQDFYIHQCTYSYLSRKHNVSEKAVRNAIHGRGVYYSQVQDDIPTDIKAKRINYKRRA